MNETGTNEIDKDSNRNKRNQQISIKEKPNIGKTKAMQKSR